MKRSDSPIGSLILDWRFKIGTLRDCNRLIKFTSTLDLTTELWMLIQSHWLPFTNLLTLDIKWILHIMIWSTLKEKTDNVSD